MNKFKNFNNSSDYLMVKGTLNNNWSKNLCIPTENSYSPPSFDIFP